MSGRIDLHEVVARLLESPAWRASRREDGYRADEAGAWDDINHAIRWSKDDQDKAVRELVEGYESEDRANASRVEPMFANAPEAKVGDLVQGQRNGELLYGEVIDATPRHYIVRWQDGFRHTCMQGFAYEPRFMAPAADQEAARAAAARWKS